MTRSDELVFKLSWLGFRFIAGIVGLMKTGEQGSDINDVESEPNGGCIERPFMFLGRRGAGDVIGRSGLDSETERPAIPDKPPKGIGANVERGIRLTTGESGDEDGEGSERSDESVHDTVVVGDDSADSVA